MTAGTERRRERERESACMWSGLPQAHLSAGKPSQPVGQAWAIFNRHPVSHPSALGTDPRGESVGVSCNSTVTCGIFSRSMFT